MRRSLLAGGFGTGQPTAEFTEVAAVVPSFQGDNRAVASQRHRGGAAKEEGKLSNWQRFKGYVLSKDYKDHRFRGKEEYADMEVSNGAADGREKEHWGPILSQDTPFFHIDIPDLETLAFDDKVHMDE